MQLKFIGFHSESVLDFRFTIGAAYDVVGSHQAFGKTYYTVVDDTYTKYNVPLDSRVYKFEVIK